MTARYGSAGVYNGYRPGNGTIEIASRRAGGGRRRHCTEEISQFHDDVRHLQPAIFDFDQAFPDRPNPDRPTSASTARRAFGRRRRGGRGVHLFAGGTAVGCSPAADSSSTTRGANSFFPARSDKNAAMSGVREVHGTTVVKAVNGGFHHRRGASSVTAITGGATNDSTVSDGQLSPSAVGRLKVTASRPSRARPWRADRRVRGTGRSMRAGPTGPRCKAEPGVTDGAWRRPSGRSQWARHLTVSGPGEVQAAQQVCQRNRDGHAERATSRRSCSPWRPPPRSPCRRPAGRSTGSSRSATGAPAGGRTPRPAGRSTASDRKPAWNAPPPAKRARSPAMTCNKAGSPPATRAIQNNTAPPAASKSGRLGPGRGQAQQRVNRHRSGFGPTDACQGRALALARQRRKYTAPPSGRRPALATPGHRGRFGLLEHHVEVSSRRPTALDAQEGGRSSVVERRCSFVAPPASAASTPAAAGSRGRHCEWLLDDP